MTRRAFLSLIVLIIYNIGTSEILINEETPNWSKQHFANLENPMHSKLILTIFLFVHDLQNQLLSHVPSEMPRASFAPSFFQ